MQSIVHVLLVLLSSQAANLWLGVSAGTSQLKFDDCYQSSTKWEGDCHRAIDGNTNQYMYYSNHSCSHTRTRLSFWHGSMKKRAHIKEIKIYNRLDCCSDRLNNFVVKVDDEQCASYNSEKVFSEITLQCNKKGQNVIIESQIKKALTLCEVQVFGEYLPEPTRPSKQLSLSNCSQSSLDWDGVCSRAIDNNTNQFYFGHSCTHTDKEKGWWKASTAKKAQIKEVTIYNRLDCCSERLTDFAVLVDGVECASYKDSDAFSVRTFKCEKVGQVIEVRSRKNTFLTLCEVQVFGEIIPDRHIFKSLGCYTDKPNTRDLSSLAGSGDMTRKKCNGLCAEKRNQYFGLQNGTECRCGDNYGSNGVALGDKNCTIACSGDSGETCGGDLRNAIFEVDKTVV